MRAEDFCEISFCLPLQWTSRLFKCLPGAQTVVERNKKKGQWNGIVCDVFATLQPSFSSAHTPGTDSSTHNYYCFFLHQSVLKQLKSKGDFFFFFAMASRSTRFLFFSPHTRSVDGRDEIKKKARRKKNTWAQQEMKTSNNSRNSFYFWGENKSQECLKFRRKCSVQIASKVHTRAAELCELCGVSFFSCHSNPNGSRRIFRKKSALDMRQNLLHTPKTQLEIWSI